MKTTWFRCATVALGLAIGVGAIAAEEGEKRNPLQDLRWQHGPMTLPLGTRAALKLPDHTGALSEEESNKFLTLTGNLPSPGTNIVAGSNWWATFEFDSSGYVKDDEKIDADALLEQLKESDGPANEQRREHKLAELHTDGWFIPPHYDAQSKHLEWALKLHASDNPEPVINYTVRILGRGGYERVVLVSTPENLQKDVAEFKQLLTAFDFNAGEKYGEFRPGDKVAEFGLAALVAGGAAAVATKTGFWKVLVGVLAAGWKVVLAVGVALLAGIGRFFRRKSGTS